MKQIFVFQRKDGSHDADFSEEFANRDGKVVSIFRANDRTDIHSILDYAGELCPERVTALARRALAELPPTEPEPVSPPGTVRARGFLGRFKWLLFGR